MQTGKVIAYNMNLGRGILESRLDGRTYQFTNSGVVYREAGLIKVGVNVFFSALNNNDAYAVEIMSTSFNRFKKELRKMGSVALD